MERELLLLVNNKHCNRVELENEIETMKKMLPYIESFISFFSNNDVFDSSNRKPVTKWRKLKYAFDNCLKQDSKYYVFCKN